MICSNMSPLKALALRGLSLPILYKFQIQTPGQKIALYFQYVLNITNVSMETKKQNTGNLP